MLQNMFFSGHTFKKQIEQRESSILLCKYSSTSLSVFEYLQLSTAQTLCRRNRYSSSTCSQQEKSELFHNVRSLKLVFSPALH